MQTAGKMAWRRGHKTFFRRNGSFSQNKVECLKLPTIYYVPLFCTLITYPYCVPLLCTLIMYPYYVPLLCTLIMYPYYVPLLFTLIIMYPMPLLFTLITRNTKGGSITVLLTYCLTGLESAV
jgi:hypothetical protein